MSIGVLTDGEWESEMDIVKWLHDEARCGFSNSKKLKEAADEIERLRKEIELLHIRIDYYMKVLALRDDIQQKESE